MKAMGVTKRLGRGGLAACLLWGCAPSIVVVHKDPTHPTAMVSVDNAPPETLEFNDGLSVRVSRGPHTVKAMPPGGNFCPWTEGGAGWTIWVDREAVLTLLPPASPGGTDSGTPLKRPKDGRKR